MMKQVSKHERKLSGIYCILNTTNGKFYIGSTVKFQGRFNEHFAALKRNDHHSIKLQNSFNKHGEEIFEFHILKTIPRDRKNLLKEEQKYLDYLQPYVRGIGYNIRASAIGDSPVEKQRYRELIGRKIIAYNLDGSFFKQFISISGAVEELDVHHAAIVKNCQGKISRVKKWVFSYYDGGEILSNILPHKHPLKDKKRPGVGVKIVATRRKNGSYNGDNLRVYNASRIGSKLSEDHKQKISNSHKGKKKSPEHLKNNLASMRRTVCKPIGVFDWLGYPLTIFDSLKECADHFGVCSATVHEPLKKQKSYKGNFLVYLSKQENRALA